jgi:hypothetical protein
MLLQQGEVRGYDFNRSVVEFTMLNRSNVILCAISTAAMDHLDDRRGVRPDQRVDQFMRLREVIEEHHVSSSKRRPRPVDPWYCEPTIFLHDRPIGPSQCPLWVISGHLQCKTSCPLYPRKRTVRCTTLCPLSANSGHYRFQLPGERLAMMLTTLNVITTSPA